MTAPLKPWPRTLADDAKLYRRLAVHPDDFDPTCRHGLVVAPCCGRRVAADCIVALHGLKTVIRGGNHRPPKDHDWACTDCLHLLVRDPKNGWTYSKLARALGAPAGAIHHERAKELVHEARLAANKAGQPHSEEQEYAKARASFPDGVRELPGTEAPND